MSSQKWYISIYCGVLFIIFSSDTFYRMLSKFLEIEYDGCPSYSLMLISSILFGIFLRYMMKHKAPSIDKWRYTYYTWYMFIFLNNPLTYNLVNNFLEKNVNIISSIGNCPTKVGLTLHTALFIIILRYSMDLEPVKK